MRNRLRHLALVSICALLLALLPVWPAFVLIASAGFGAVVMTAVKLGYLPGIWLSVRRFWPVILLFLAFYFLPYSQISPTVRQSGEYFSLFRRFAGTFSLWDLLLMMAFAVLLLRRLLNYDFNITLGQKSIHLLALVFVISLAVGLLHVSGTPAGYGTTEFKRPLIAWIPPFYFVLCYLLIMNYAQTASDARSLLRWMTWLTILLTVYGIGRFVLIMQNRIETMWPFGMPIVLYDQMVMLYPLLFALPAFHLIRKSNERSAMSIGYWLLWFVMVGLIVCSARRFNYVLLFLGLVIMILMGLYFRWWNPRSVLSMLARGTAFGAASVALLIWLSPGVYANITAAIKSLDMTSRIGYRQGGDIRLAEMKNMVLNMEQRPYSFLVGMGLGTKWQELEEQPLDSFTYPRAYVASSRGWFPQFHLPYLASLYRYGMLGFSFMLLILWFHLKGMFRSLNNLEALWLRAASIGMLVFILFAVPNIGDSANPTSAILAGFCTGILARLQNARQV